jgi:hypothetical protein
MLTTAVLMLQDGHYGRASPARGGIV